MKRYFGIQGIPQRHTTQQFHTKDLLRKTQENGCLCEGEKQQQTEEEGLVQCFLGVEFYRVEIPRIGIGRISSPELKMCSGIGGISNLETDGFSSLSFVGFQVSELSSGFLLYKHVLSLSVTH